ncbi:hypothetical protein AGMMS50268_04300 [Spirochaetia bacterium]|nr:hypothetical protein AGMMS50268_04300 [Spirochaetia bacterium]
MNGGTINNNTATGSGGGVYVDGGTFNKNGNSSIVNNSAVLDGSQVYVWVDSSTGDRYRYADAGPGDTIDVPTDNGNAQGAAPWL